MGGSVSKGIEHNTKQIGVGLDKTVGAVGAPGGSLDQGMKGLGNAMEQTVGRKGLGGAVNQGLSELNKGISHNMQQIGNVASGLGSLLTGGNPFDQGGGNKGPMTSEANYSQRSGSTGKTSGSKKKADMGDSKTKKSQRGKRALTIRK